jgi:DNA-binding MarR family transcriptional regulator
VAAKLLTELKQTKPFQSVEQEAFLNVIKTADFLQQVAAQVLRGHQMSEAQYNVLRILRGAGDEGLKCSEIGDRMVTRDPDITRLLDRIEKQGWIERNRSTSDRRVVTTRITQSGLDKLAELDAPLAESLERVLGRLGSAKLQTLIDLLEEVR